MDEILLKLQELEKKDRQEEETLKLLLHELATLKHKVVTLRTGQSPATGEVFVGIPSRTASQSDTSSMETAAFPADGSALAPRESPHSGGGGGANEAELESGRSVSEGSAAQENPSSRNRRGDEEDGRYKNGDNDDDNDDGDDDDDADEDGEDSDEDVTELQLMLDGNFESLLNDLRKCAGPTDRQKTLTEHVKTHNWTCHQLCLLLPTLPFPNERVRAVSLVSPKILDRQHRAELVHLVRSQPQQERAKILEAFDKPAS